MVWFYPHNYNHGHFRIHDCQSRSLRISTMGKVGWTGCVRIHKGKLSSVVGKEVLSTVMSTIALITESELVKANQGRRVNAHFLLHMCMCGLYVIVYLNILIPPWKQVLLTWFVIHCWFICKSRRTLLYSIYCSEAGRLQLT